MSHSSGPKILADAGAGFLLRRASCSTGASHFGTLSALARLGLLRDLGDMGGLDPTLLPFIETGEQTSLGM
jgi:hypothetical protein